MKVVWPLGYAAGLGSRWGGMVEALAQADGCEVRSLARVDGPVVFGPPGEELVAFDLLVTGSRGHGPLRRLMLRSTSAYVARSARCPVLVLPALPRHQPNAFLKPHALANSG